MGWLARHSHHPPNGGGCTDTPRPREDFGHYTATILGGLTHATHAAKPNSRPKGPEWIIHPIEPGQLQDTIRQLQRRAFVPTWKTIILLQMSDNDVPTDLTDLAGIDRIENRQVK